MSELNDEIRVEWEHAFSDLNTFVHAPGGLKR
jgi:hypothetical protein